MTVALGVNAGFCASAPSGDPGGALSLQVSGRCHATRDVVPAGATLITEIGWYCTTATQEANWEAGAFAHTGTDPGAPYALLSGASRTNAKGTSAGWKIASGLSIPVTAGAIVWPSVQLDATATATKMAYAAAGAGYFFWDTTSTTTLPDTFSLNSSGNNVAAIYALYSGPSGPVIPVLTYLNRRRRS